MATESVATIPDKLGLYNEDYKNTALGLIGRFQGIAELMQCVQEDDMKGDIVRSVGCTIESLVDECWELIDRPLAEARS